MYCKELSCDIPICWTNRNDPTQEPCEALHLDADIAGSGVVAAYVTSAGLTILVMLIAYFSHSLPDEYLEYYDKKVILKSTGVPRFIPWFQSLNRHKRIAVFQAFMLAISDQQLITGLAMLVSNLVLRCQLSALNYTIATSLAWFSSTVHILTLSVLKSYFRKHAAAFVVRIIIMWTIYILLCWASYRPSINTALGQYPGIPIDCLASQSLDTSDVFSAMAPLVPLGLFLGIVTFKIIGPKLKSTSTTSRVFYYRFRVLNLLLSKILKYRIVFEEAWLLRRSNSRKSYLEVAGKGCMLRRYGRGLLYFCCNSFLALFCATMFVFAYGLSYTFSLLFLNYGIVTVTDSSGASFGQLLPLILLVLPHLSAVEALWEIWDDKKKHKIQDSDTIDTHVSSPPTPITQTGLVTSTSGASHSPRIDEMIDQQFLEHFDSIKKFCYKEYTEANGDNPSNSCEFDAIKKQELLDKLERMKEAEDSLWKDCGHFSVTQQGIILILTGCLGARFGLTTASGTYYGSGLGSRVDFITALCVIALVFSILFPWFVWFMCMSPEIRQSRSRTILPTQSIPSTETLSRTSRSSSSEVVRQSAGTLSVDLESRGTASSEVAIRDTEQRSSIVTDNRSVASVLRSTETDELAAFRRQLTVSFML